MRREFSGSSIFHEDSLWEGPYDEKKSAGWYFWDETGADCVGPYESRKDAEKALQDYAEYLNTCT